MPLEELVWQLMLDTGFYLAMGAMPGGQQRQANLRALVDRSLTYRKGQNGSLYGFIRYAEAVKEKKVAGSQVKLVSEGDELVKIMTIHKSKGLEFPMVILTGFCKRLNYTAPGSRTLLIHKDLGLGFPVINTEESWYRTTALQKLIKARLRQEEVEEEKRVLYVALTRPKDRLAILGICEDVQEALDKAGSEPPKDSSYFQMTGNRICTRMNQYEIIEDKDLARLASHHNRHVDRVLDLLDRSPKTGNEDLTARVRSQMEFSYPNARELAVKSKYSVSELNAGAKSSTDRGRRTDSLSEPASFKSREVFTAAQRGTIYHTLLEHLDFRTLWAAEDEEKRRDEVKAAVQWLVENQFLTAEEADILDGKIILRLAGSELGSRMAAAEAEGRLQREQPFNLRMDYDPDGSGQMTEVIVQGVIDCWFEEEDGLVLVDYKTGQGPDMADRYRTQMDLYGRALEVCTGKKVKESYIYLTGTGKLVEV